MADMASLERALIAAIGGDAVSRDAGDRVLFSQDVFSRTADVALVGRPATAEQVAAIVRLAGDHGAIVVTRGGGMSYSGGYLSPDPARTVAVDLAGMDRIVAVDADDMHVLVEPGCTWAALDARLAPLGLRTPYRGTLSGRRATVGGAISQNAIFWGSGRAGSAVDSVLGLEVVTAAGGIVRTGSMGVAGSTPFFRHFGPDLTGLFTADAGAHGIKTAIALRLERVPRLADGLSFLVPDAATLCALMAEVARSGRAAVQMGLDDGLKTARVADGGLAEDLRTAWRVFRHAPRWTTGMAQVARMALAGRRFLDAMPFSLHLFVEGDSAAAIAATQSALRRIALGQGAREVAASVPRAMLATPFPPLNGLTGPAGERWVPVHCIVPLSRAHAAQEAIAAILARHAADMAGHGIAASWLFTTIGNHAFVIEPMFFWPDALDAIHRAAIGAARLARFPTRPDAPDARALVSAIRAEIVTAVDAMGALHIQLGRFYPYAARLDPATAALTRAVRATLDPAGTINPQALSR